MKEKEETFISYIFRYSSYSSKKKKIKFSYKHFQEESLRTLSMETLENIKLFSSPNPIHPYFIVTRLNKIFNWAVHPRGLVKPSTSRAISR